MPLFKSVLTLFSAMLMLSLAHLPAAEAGTQESARRLITLLDVPAQLEETIIAAVEAARGDLLKRGLPPVTVDRATTTLQAEMLASMPGLLDEVTVIYADEFTEPELLDLIAFYETPTGQKFVKSQRTLNARQTTAMQGWLQSVRTRAIARLQETQV